MTIQHKTIIVTGGGSGIGQALVLELLQRGARVAAVDVHEDALQETLRQAGECAEQLTLHAMDITDAKAVEELIVAVQRVHGQLDGIINNAGIIQPFVRVNNLGMDVVQRVMNVNFFAPLHLIKTALPVLLQRPEAHIVNVSSMGGFLPVPGQSVYGASKAAIKLLSEGLYAELRETHVHVTIVFPGATATNITKNSGVQVPSMPQSSGKTMSATSAKDVASMVVNAIEKNKLYVYTGTDSKMMNMLYRICPQFATNFIAKQMKALLQ